MQIEKIVVVEDDAVVRQNLVERLRQHRYEVAGVPDLLRARELLANDTFDLVFADVRLPDGAGTDLLRELASRPQSPLVVVMTGFASVESAVNCMRDGAFDYLIKPFSYDQIELILKKAEDMNRLLGVSRYFSRGENEESNYSLVGSTPPMHQLRALIRKVARTEATVLIQGESGTGKELVARALYAESSRAQAPFIKVNCAAIPENLIESEFFGHERGAFTGALSKREGRFELAHGGTILLDEISEIAPSVQAKLLRVLQERELERVGGNRTIKVDVRVIATTNRNLEQSVERKEFREDLFFRLNVVPIHVPALRERRADIGLLAEQFVQRFTRKHGTRVSGISADCLAAMLAHDWPGNVRELQNVLERAVILCENGQPLRVDDLGFRLKSAAAPVIAPQPLAQPQPLGPSHPAVPEFLLLEEVEKRHILDAVERCAGNRTQAAKRLGISVRTLRNKLHEYGANGKADGDDLDSEEADLGRSPVAAQHAPGRHPVAADQGVSR